MTQDELKSILHYEPETGVFTWINSGLVANSICPLGYRRIKYKKKTYKQHRLAWLYMTGNMPKEFIDHINHIRHDNRWCNLREATNSQNQHNRIKPKTNTKSGLIGAGWNDTAKLWMSSITINKVKINLGYFKTKESAHEAYIEAKRKYHTFAVF